MKPTRHLAQLVIHDLARFSGLTFKHEDRLTREEAQQLTEWATKHPEVAKALRDRSHPEHEGATLFAGVVRHFQYEHPQEAAGGPAAWTEGRLLSLHTRIADMTSEEAAARLEWARTTAEYREGYADPSHPQHADFVSQTTALLERAEGAAPGATEDGRQAGQEPGQGEGKGQEKADQADGPSPAALGRIHELQRDPAYGDPQHPNHRAAVAAVTEAFRAAYPKPGAPARSLAEVREAGLHHRVKEVREHPAFMDRAHPEHGAKQAEMRAAFEQAYPEPEE